jgi:hypothetical protein
LQAQRARGDVAAQQRLHEVGQPDGQDPLGGRPQVRHAPPAVPGDHGALKVFLAVRVQFRVRDPQEKERVRAQVQLSGFLGVPQASGGRHDRPEFSLGDGEPGLLEEFPHAGGLERLAPVHATARREPPSLLACLPTAKQQDPTLRIGHKEPRGRPPDGGLVHKSDIT